MCDYIQVCGDHFEKNGEPVMLRGWALGSWMNLEHFMIGMPGTNSMIIHAFEEVYGKDCAAELMDNYIRSAVQEEDICFLKKLGTNTLRIVLGYHWFWDDDNPFVLREEGPRYLDRVLRFCENNDMYVILDLHSVPGSQNTDWHSDNITGQELFWKYRCFQDQVIWFWEEMARRYHDRTCIIGYDVINEPGWSADAARSINRFYREVLTAIRKHDKHHILFLEGTDFGRDFSALEEIEDDQIAYTVHFYPFVLEENILDPGMDDHRRLEIMTEIFDRQLRDTARFHRPIWCGESGYEILDGQEEFYAMLLLHNIDLCEARGISWNLWTYKDARRMGIVIPGRDSRWIQLRQRIGEQWSHDREQEISMAVVHYIGKTYYAPVEGHFAYALDFRVRSILHEIAVEQILKPTLRQIPWGEMKSYPEDFLFSHCEKRETVISAVRERLQASCGMNPADVL